MSIWKYCDHITKQRLIRMKKVLKYISLSHIVGVSVLAVVISLLFFGMDYLLNSYQKKALEQRASSVERQCNVLADRIARGEMNSYIMETDRNEDGANVNEVIWMANSFGGRILIIDEHFRILTDTYNQNCGQYLFTSEIVSALRGNVVPYRKVGDEYIQVLTRINGSDGSQMQGVILAMASLYDHNKMYSFLNVQRQTLIGIFFLLAIILAVLLDLLVIRSFRGMQKELYTIASGHQDMELSRQGLREFYEMADAFNRIINRYIELENSRQEFVSNVSHELKTPITSMKILADSLLMQEDVSPEVYAEFLEDIVHEIDRENQIITDLLYLVKMDKPTQDELNIKETDINELLNVLLKRISPIAARRNITIHLETLRQVTAEVDEVKLALACNNIIENAVKYNEDGGTVDVSLNADHKFFYIRVKDTGCGIPEDCQEQIFERFYRVDKARSRDTGGTGLGLAITRKVLLLHKGSIKVHSVPGEGSTFTIRVPLNYIA